MLKVFWKVIRGAPGIRDDAFFAPGKAKDCGLEEQFGQGALLHIQVIYSPFLQQDRDRCLWVIQYEVGEF